jgi:ribonuclease P/MRP protein subunit POP5
MMDHIPVKDGNICTYRVVHVSGTMRKVEEEAIRRDRDLMFAVKDAAGAKNNSALAAIMGEGKRTREQQAAGKNPYVDVDVEDESEDEDMADYNDD